MNAFIMLIGLPASGKSSFCRAFEGNEGQEIISSDTIRGELFGSEEDQNHNGEVFEVMRKRTLAALKAHKSVIYDATNLSAKRRTGFLKNLPNGVLKKAFVFVAPLEVLYARNAKRDRHVPEDVIFNMMKRFEVPDVSEGWNEIEIIGQNEFNFEPLDKVLDQAIAMEHDNPHHQLSVGNHMLAAQRFASEQHSPYIIQMAAKYHDIGKVYTKVFHNTRGEKSEIAHYYNHENVGAYLWLTLAPIRRMSNSTCLYIANLIQHHMDFFKGEKYLEKVEARFGSEFMSDLYALHEADIHAH